MEPSGEDREDRTEQIASAWPRLLLWAVALALFCGLLWRTVRYLMQFPLWGDEAMVMVDVLDCDYYGLTQTLPVFQIAPLLFLWAERLALELLGSSELAVRLPALLTGSLGLLMFAYFGRRWLSPSHGALAIALLAVSYYPVRHATEAKPYALDLFMSVGLLLGTLGWLRQPGRNGWLIFLVCWVPLAILSSYPAVFVAGAMSLVLLPKVWLAPGKARWLFVTYNLLMILAFIGHYFGVARHQFDAPERRVQSDVLRAYWQDSFPPESLAAWPWWLVKAHTGGLFAYPLGGKNFGGSAWFMLAVLGGWFLWKCGQRSLLLACLLPFGLTFVAAALHKYPYGDSPRVVQHLAPMACLLIAAGGACLLERIRDPGPRWRWAGSVCLLLATISLVGTARDVAHPYKMEHDRCVWGLMRDFWPRVGPGEPVVLCNLRGDVPAVAEWYLRRKRTNVTWVESRPRVAPATADAWLIRFTVDLVPVPSAAEVVAMVGESSKDWAVAECRSYPLPPGSPDDPGYYCTIVRLTPSRLIGAVASSGKKP